MNAKLKSKLTTDSLRAHRQLMQVVLDGTEPHLKAIKEFDTEIKRLEEEISNYYTELFLWDWLVTARNS